MNVKQMIQKFWLLSKRNFYETFYVPQVSVGWIYILLGLALTIKSDRRYLEFLLPVLILICFTSLKPIEDIKVDYQFPGTRTFLKWLLITLMFAKGFYDAFGKDFRL